MPETFFTYRNFRWLRICAGLLVVMTAVYLWKEPLGGRNGGTVVGYTLGGIATAAILYLMWFGIRKRSHYAKYTTLKGCLSVHVWLGLALVLIVPLHSGFQFGYNVHTLAYALMVATILSGILGSVIYVRFPARVQSHRGGGTIRHLLEQVNVISSDIDFLAKDRSDHFIRLQDLLDSPWKPSVYRALWRKKPNEAQPKEIAAFLAKLPKTESDEGYQLVSLATKKRQLIQQIENEVRVMAAFRSWLYLHLPLSFGLLVAVAVHIFSVFYYR
ncbi:MAG: hypothetical protein U0136_08490 [Bdellovibrionota bacterium]